MLEYVKEPCFIQPKNGMKSGRYQHCAVYDEKRGRIYVFGGVGDSNDLSTLNLESDEESDYDNNFLKSSEYYDIR